jgi:hypothetical protein
MKNVARLNFVEHLLYSLTIPQVTLHEAQPRNFSFGSETMQLVGADDVPTFSLKKLYEMATYEALGPGN